MSKSRNILSIAAAVGFSLTTAGVMAVPFGGVSALDADRSGVADRVALGFATLPATIDPPAELSLAAGRAAKGDFFERPGCFGQVWPDITADCLSKASGLAAMPVRTVTIGYQVASPT